MIKNTVQFVVMAVCISNFTFSSTSLKAETTEPFHRTFRTISTEHPSNYNVRLQNLFNYLAAHPHHGVYAQALKMMAGQPPDDQDIFRALIPINERQDCGDFRLTSILRILYQFNKNPFLSDSLRRTAKDAVLHFKYWPDEPGIDNMCTWSENHHISFAANAYLAGQLFPDEVFSNSGETGRQKMEKFRPRILRWLDLRFRSGFSEWLSSYYSIDFSALLNLVDFCQDEEISRQATMVVDLLLTDLAVNHFHGALGSTHGRYYEHDKKNANKESTKGIFALLFGIGEFHGFNGCTASFALSKTYHLPRVLFEIANDVDRPEMINRQRMGIRLKNAKAWGLDFNRLEDGMTFLSLEAYAHPKTINLTMRMFSRYNWWENTFFAPFKKHKKLIEFSAKFHALPLIAKIFEKDLTRNTREQVNIYTYRTPDYMLSSAQDYRKGYGGDQQHIWQATLDAEAVCFTTHPVERKVHKNNVTPNYWTGSGNLPRVAQYKNVALILYKISTMPGLYLTHKLKFTHAWFPKDKYDQIIEKNGWIFGRKKNGYVALWSQKPYKWQDHKGEDKNREIIAHGKQNIWICEMGRKQSSGSFQNFINAISSAPIKTHGLKVVYLSPTAGKVQFGWDSDFLVQGQHISLQNYPRYDNPYIHADFPCRRVQMEENGYSLILDWDSTTRKF